MVDLFGEAYGRISLLGNPSDIYGGKCISFTFNKKAIVSIKDSDKLKICNNGCLEENLNYNGKHDLVKATINLLGLENEKVEINYDSDIPLGSGLAGSSAIVIALMRAFNEGKGLSMSKYEIAEKSLRVETEELGISAGFQDRYAISFEGINYFDFSGKEYMMESDSYGKIETLRVEKIPFFLSLGIRPKCSAVVHNSLRNKFMLGGYESRRIKNFMDLIGDLAEEGKSYLVEGKWEKLGQLMDKNTSIREQICPHNVKDLEMISKAKDLGALGAKIAGSGGAVLVLSDDNKVFDNMSRNYPCYKPEIVKIEK